jgi:hypothetical protein
MPPGKARQCQGYKISSCWIKTLNQSALCPTCLYRQYEDTLINIHTQTTEDILQILQEHDIHEYILHSYDTFDKILKLLYIHSRHTLTKYLQLPSIQGILCTRVRHHSETDLCPVYSWIIRNDSNLYILPKKCIRCLTSTLAYSPMPELFRMLRFINVPIDQNDSLQMTLRKALKNRSYIKEFVDAVMYSTPQHLDEVLKFIDKYNPSNSVREDCKYHPSNIARCLADASTQKFDMYTFIANNTEKFKDELMSVAWDPSRVLDWCIDVNDMYTIHSSFRLP